ncbi:MAG: glycosyltransferase [Planctomycetes bacterium]|nr:glycosyltransferase [Planctomycetota bacterium]
MSQPNPLPDPFPGDDRSTVAWPPGRVLAVAATYNEAANLATLVGRVLAADPAIQLLVVDDDSPDGTGRSALSLAETEPRFHVLVRRGRRGLGGAIVEGFHEARRQGFEIAVNLDADLSHDPDDIPRLLAALEPSGGRPADVALGSRRVAGGAIEGWPWRRHLTHRLVCWFTRWVIGVPARDGSTGFRAVRLDTFARLRGELPTGYAFFEHLLWEVHRAGGRIVEVPITFVERQRGSSKVRPGVMAEAARDLLSLVWARWRS